MADQASSSTALSATTTAVGHLQPRLSKLAMVAMSFAILNTWIAVAGTIGLVLPSGGAVSLLYGFIFCVLCNFALVASLGELAAIWPTAGGQYHFVYALCTEKYKKSMSFVVGWINIAGWLTLVTTEGFFAAQFISASAVIVSDGSYEPKQYATYLIFLAILLFSTVGNIYGNRILGAWNNLALYWSVLSVVILCILLLSTSEKRGAQPVFTSFENETGWSDGVAWILGMLQSALSLIGFDVVLHMTEEMPHPSHDAPLAMMYAIGIGGITGVAVILVILFCLVDEAAVLGTSTGMPIVELVFRATGSRAAACVIGLMLGVCFINGTSASTTSASRLIYAMARDKGIVCHAFFARLHPRWNVPINAVLLSSVFNLLFGLLFLGPTVAFNAYISACTVFLNMSYALPVVLLLIRGRRVLSAFQTASTPFQLGPVCGTICNWVAAVYVIFTSIFFCFPPALPVSGSSMNYVSAFIGAFAILLAVYWLVYGKEFEGPQLDIITGEQAVEATDLRISVEPSTKCLEAKRRSSHAA